MFRLRKELPLVFIYVNFDNFHKLASISRDQIMSKAYTILFVVPNFDVTPCHWFIRHICQFRKVQDWYIDPKYKSRCRVIIFYFEEFQLRRPYTLGSNHSQDKFQGHMEKTIENVIEN